MTSLLVVIFVVELAAQLINTIGAATINGLLWRFVLSLPISVSKQHTEHREKQKQYLAVRQELNATSSQDQFAKWAKLNRQHDKLLDELKVKKASLEAARASFDRYLTFIRLVLTRGVQWFLPFWYPKQPMVWLPYGWFPSYVERFASFPRAPIGSVSIVVWQWACYGILKLIIEGLVGALGLAAAFKRKQAVPVAAGAAEEKKTS